jgi:UDP-N-acetylglucosamine 2-epimerase (non-hydrolysing)
MRIDFIYGTRPELIKLAMPIRFFLGKNDFEVRIISTGQHSEMLNSLEAWFGITPDVCLDGMVKGQSLEDLTARLLTRMDQFYRKNGDSDVVVVQGDTTSAFIGGLNAFYKKIRIAHIEAGLRTFNKLSPWPEEMNRILLSRLADFHFTPTDLNKDNLLSEGIKEENIFVTGNTVIDALLFSKEKILLDGIYPVELMEFFRGRFSNNPIVLITGHRRENLGTGFESLCYAIRELASMNPDVYFIYPVHLNPQVRGTVNNILGKSSQRNVVLLEPLNYPDFVSLLQRCYLVLTDSGGLQEEAPTLGKPVLVIRENTERPEAVARGAAKLVGTEKERIVREVNKLLNDNLLYLSMAKAVNPYGDGKASSKIFEILSSHE